MDSLPYLFISLFADFAIVAFVGYYFYRFNNQERDVETREKKLDSRYHHVVDEALAKERKIIEDATIEAEEIIKNTKELSEHSVSIINQALEKMATDLNRTAGQTGNTLLSNYSTSLRDISNQSVNNLQTVTRAFEEALKKQTLDFQNAAVNLEADLEKQIKNFGESLLPTLERELEEYKTERLRQTEQLVKTVIQKASEDVFNKSISLEDHEKLILESLEKAKKEGMFN